MGASPRTKLFWLLVFLFVQQSSLSRAQGTSSSNPDADFGIGDSSVGEQGDIGAPDPLNGLEENKINSAPVAAETGKSSPEFKDLPPSSDDSSAKQPSAPPAGSSNAESTAPSAPSAPAASAKKTSEAEPEIPPPAIEAPAAPVTKSARHARSKAPVEDESAGSRGADSPDFRRERNFHSIYQKFNLDPTPVDAWEQAVSSAKRESQTYKVQRGDTLWDLSKTFFGDTHYWPKVWALNNDQVQNPHEIDTWMQIRFFPGDLNEPPTLAVTEASPPVKVSPSASADAPETTTTLPMPPAKKRAAVLRNLPASLPISSNPTVRKIPGLDFRGVQAPSTAPRPNLPLTYFVTESVPRAEGLIKETELGGTTASEFQYIFVKGVQAGKVYTVIKDVGSIKDPKRPEAEPAHLVEVQGEIEVLEAANAAGLNRAIVRRNLAQVEVGSALVPGPLPIISTADGPATGGPALLIIGSEFSHDRKMVDAEGIVFLNGGTANGVAVGQIFPIHSDPLLRNQQSEVRTSSRVVGHVRIVKTDERFSTGYLTQITDEIAIGDLVGSSDVASALPSDAPAFEDEPDMSPSSASNTLDSDAGSTTIGGDDFSLDDSMSAPANSPSTEKKSNSGSAGSDDDFNL